VLTSQSAITAAPETSCVQLFVPSCCAPFVGTEAQQGTVGHRSSMEHKQSERRTHSVHTRRAARMSHAAGPCRALGGRLPLGFGQPTFGK
jgi:hypothetical protein